MLSQHVKWFMRECYGRLGETMQTLRIAGYLALEERKHAITKEHLINGRHLLGKAMENTTYQYNQLQKKKGLK